ncbi:hypothetical protein XELAEV_18046323mg [Xenopus laevis]|uniref:B30.2/SPRY domain-containing protein n=1 Tax=Xenopus laevis TaxID=8355 RepID=A0A974BTG2_XENLA|nr:hypothetical protein XELAEV_18046323mg [Xenopus laevis]
MAGDSGKGSQCQPEGEDFTFGQEATGLSLNTMEAGRNVSVSNDGRTVSCVTTNRHPPEITYRWYGQTISRRCFPSGHHFWDVEGSEPGYWRVGVAYPTIETAEYEDWLGNNNQSWALCRWANNNTYTVRHDGKETKLCNAPSCRKIRISLDYEAGRLSFYELSDPIRHLYTFTAKFTQPLHAAFAVWVGNASVTIIS